MTGFDSKRAAAANKQEPAQESWREFASDYERGFIDGMQKQAQSSVDKAVNRMAQPAQEAVKERKNNKEWKVFDRGTRKQLKEYVSKVLQEKNNG